ncbi:permease-like cell division protein FtsX [Paenibacillus pasadenensis]|uniref:permease-like cell division protein FtsX n=1 Tax=Paenibacillus pasadenensis TaxID=217090 RepID=UPI00203BC0B4|nr:permease-like cell division protein FtsX [Paenibacillus pasadenensis]MCM3750231.1 permease-like cell division protein FtsX [Paenibacillus pasadenensis]
MKLRTLGRHIREGIRNIFRNGWMSFASVSSIFVSLFILSVFMMLALNVDKLAGQLESQVEIRAFLQMDTAEADVKALENKLRNISGVKGVEYRTPEQNLQEMSEMLGEDGKQLLQDYQGEDNPMPASFTIEVFDPVAIATVAGEVTAISSAQDPPAFQQVKYGQGTVETLFKITDMVRNVGLAIVAGLAITAMFLIATTIKTTIIGRQREISIMKLVGATNAFIRWPFFVEGALIGFLSSALTAAVVLLGYGELVRQSEFDLGLLSIQLISISEAASIVIPVTVGIGTMLGVWGSVLSVRRYLKV